MTTALVPLSIDNPLPSRIIVLSQEVLAEANALSERAAALTITDTDTMAVGDQVYRDLATLSKRIEAERQRLKAPILELGRSLDSCAKAAMEPMEAARAALGSRIAVFVKEENRRREEERKRIAEEQARQQRERDERERRRLEEEARQVPDSFDALPDESTVVITREPEPAPMPIVANVKSHAVRKKTVTTLIIGDRSKIPLEVGGVPLWTLDEKAVERLLKAGVQVPECRLEKTEDTAAKAGF